MMVCRLSCRTSHFDRRWEYQCGSGGDNLANVSTTCTLQVGPNSSPYFEREVTPAKMIKFQMLLHSLLSLQPPVNAAGEDIEFACPDNGYLGGFQSAFDSDSFDRIWTPYCCQRPFAALIDCIQPTSGWENDFRTTLNFSAPEGHIIAGVTSFFFNRFSLPSKPTICLLCSICTSDHVCDNVIGCLQG